MSDIGKILEARYHRIMIRKGFCTFRNVLILPEHNTKIATDIDLLSIKYNETLDRYLINTECKSGNIEVFDRLFWVNGVGSFLKSNKSSLIVNKYITEYIEFAKALNIDLISTNEIDDTEKVLNISPDSWPGLSAMHIWDDCFISIEKYSNIPGVSDKLVQYFKEANRYSRLDVWKGFNFNTFNKVIRLIRDIVKEADGFKSKIEVITLCQVYISILLILFSHSIIHICHDIMLRPKTERFDYLKAKLTFGEQDIEYLKRFISSMNKIVRTTLHNNGVEDLFIDRIDITNSLREPEYSDSLFKLLSYFIGKTNHLINLPYAIEITQFPSTSENYVTTKVNEGNHLFELVKAFIIQEFQISKDFLSPINPEIIVSINKKERNITTGST